MCDDNISIMTVSQNAAKKVRKKSTRHKFSAAGRKLVEWIERIEGGTSFMESVTALSSKLSEIYNSNEINPCFGGNDAKLSPEAEKLIQESMGKVNIRGTEMLVGSSKQLDEHIEKVENKSETFMKDNSPKHPEQLQTLNCTVELCHVLFTSEFYDENGVMFRQFDFK